MRARYRSSADGGATGGSVRQASTDATLSALTVNGAGVAGFAAATTSYEAGVAAAVATATVIATATHSGASVAYSGTDADGVAAGHQVALSAGRNAVTVTVTAQDGATTEDYTVSVNRGVTAEYGWKASHDLDGLIAAGNGWALGVWSNGTTMWVADGTDKKLYAYKASDRTRDSAKDFDTLDGAANDNPYGIWSNGATMWVADSADDKLYAYKMSDKTRDSSKDISLEAANGDPGGIWSNGATMWVTDTRDAKLYAYDMATKARDSSEDFNTLSTAGNGFPAGIWSDDATMWVADSASLDKLFAYDLASKARVGARDFGTLIGAGNRAPRDVWSDGTTLWVTQAFAKVFSYNLPVYPVSASVSAPGTSLEVVFSQDLAAAAPAGSAFTVERTPDGGAEETVALSGSPTVSGRTVTLTLSSAIAAADTDVKVSYAKPASGDKLANGGGTEVSSFADLAVAVITAPGAPTGLSATARGPARIDLAWTAPTSDGGASVSGYKVEVSVDGGSSFADLAADTASTAVTYSHTGLAANSTRHYRVSAINSVGAGAASDSASDVTNVFVRNLAQGDHEDDDAAGGLSQRFTTGANVGGYILASVEIVSGDADSDDFTADVFSVDTASGHPTGSGTRLVAPGSFAAGTLTFTAPAGTRLDAGTTYALVVEAIGSESVVYERTTSTAEDSGGASGWGIQNTYEWKDTGGTWRDDTDSRSLRIAIRGTAVSLSSDAALSALSVAPKDIVGFDAGRDSYEVGVASTVASATVVAAAADSGASVAYSGTDADAVAAGHQVSLSAGRNEVTVTVTAEDTTTTEDYTVSVNRGVRTEFGWKAVEDLDGLAAAGNDAPSGVWSDGATVWVADVSDAKIYAYDASDKTRDSSKDFDTLDAAGNDSPQGIWSDGVTMWVADWADARLYAYDLATKAHDGSEDFGTLSGAGNGHPLGIWSDGAAMWVADWADDKLYAYDMATKAHDGSEDFGTLAAATNNFPAGIWSDEATMWVADGDDDKLYAYDMATKARDSAKDFGTLSGAGNNGANGIWSDGTTMWVADGGDDKAYSYNLPVYAVSATVTGTTLEVVFSQDLDTAAVPASSAFGVGKTAGGTSSAVSLTGSPTVSGDTVTLTLAAALTAADTDVEVSYTVPASGDRLAGSGGNEVSGFVELAAANNTAATAPGQPTALTATATGPNRIDLAWTAPASTGGAAISGYRIESSADGTTFTALAADTASTATSYADTGLTANTTRRYRVSAINSVGAGPASNTASDVTNVFVRNTGQGNSTTHSSGSDQSQRFTTGAHPGGYTLTSVEIVSADGEGDDFTAEIWTVDAVTGHPSAEHATLVAPGSFAAGTLTFAAPPDTVLAAGTIYAVVTSPVGGDVTYSGTTSDGEDAGFASGWEIQDDHEYKSGGAWTDNGSNRSLRIAVRGAPKTASTGGGTPGGGTPGGGTPGGGTPGGAVGSSNSGGSAAGGGGGLDVGVATLVVANGWSPPDIGAAAVLAARTADAVVVYTAGDELSQATAELLREAQPAKIIIVGGVAAVPSDVRTQIRSASPDSRLERIDGIDRAHTAAAVARRVLGSPSGAGRVAVIVANGASPPDIGAAAALAARSGRSAVLYTQHDRLPEPTAALLRDYQTHRVILIGGTAAISDETQAAVAAAAGDDASVTRLTGADRVDTAAQAARRVLGNPAAAPRDITLVIANGWSPPDVGVAAALTAATPNAAVAYTEHAALPAATRALIADYKPTTIIIIGGTAAVTNDVRQALTDAAPDNAAIRRITGADRTDTAARAARRTLTGP